MKVKTSTLTGAALDWAVCMANGMKPEDIYISCMGRYTSLFRRLRDDDGQLNGRYMTGPDLLFSSKWEAGGPIIDREIHNLFKWNQLDPSAAELWCGVHNRKTDSGVYAINVDGPTALIAAMRCYVASKLGDEVDVPEELLT